MAFALRKNDSEFDPQPIADINVTPLVDVMLVLLIVFMVAAPLMTAGIPVDLPKTQAKQLNDQQPPIVVSVDANGGYFVDKHEAIGVEGLLAALKEGSENNKDRRVTCAPTRRSHMGRSRRLWASLIPRAMRRSRLFPRRRAEERLRLQRGRKREGAPGPTSALSSDMTYGPLRLKSFSQRVAPGWRRPSARSLEPSNVVE
jgi:biopolymer transport protein TolR